MNSSAVVKVYLISKGVIVDISDTTGAARIFTHSHMQLAYLKVESYFSREIAVIWALSDGTAGAYNVGKANGGWGDD